MAKAKHAYAVRLADARGYDVATVSELLQAAEARLVEAVNEQRVE